MLTVLVGADTLGRAKKLAGFVEGAEKGSQQVSYISDIHFSVESLTAAAQNTSLFGDSALTCIVGVADTAERRDALLSLLPLLSESGNQFVISEEALPAAFIKKAEAVDALVLSFEKKTAAKKVDFVNLFALTDAYSDRKRSLAWPLYTRAIEMGAEPREIASKLFWAIKSMLLASGGASATTSGLSPFVYTKAKAGATKFTKEELTKSLLDLTVLFHEALVSGTRIEIALEAFILRSLEKKA